MAHGDGFQLAVSHQLVRLMGSSTSQAGSTAESSTARDVQPRVSDQHMPEQLHDVNPAQRFMTPLHVFQLEGHEVVLQLVNAQLAQPTNAMAQALHVPFNCIEALHIMPIAPDGFPELAIPAIVQRVGDIDLHSTDRLILIDTIYHHHPSPSGLLDRPTVVRTVQRVSCQVTRQQILFKAAVYHYCQFLQEGCAVSLDGYLWPINHVDPRPVTHGSYATVDVPPPYGTQLDTQMVANQLHDNGTMNTMMNWLTEPDDLPDDAMQLMQVGVTKRAVGTMTKYHLRRACQQYPLPAECRCIDDFKSPTVSRNEPSDNRSSIGPVSNAIEPFAEEAPSTTRCAHNAVQFKVTDPADPIVHIDPTPKPVGQTKSHQFFKRSQGIQLGKKSRQVKAKPLCMHFSQVPAVPQVQRPQLPILDLRSPRTPLQQMEMHAPQRLLYRRLSITNAPPARKGTRQCLPHRFQCSLHYLIQSPDRVLHGASILPTFLMSWLLSFTEKPAQ